MTSSEIMVFPSLSPYVSLIILKFLSMIMNYSYYNNRGETCVVLNVEKLKELYKAENIYLVEPDEDNKE